VSALGRERRFGPYTPRTVRVRLRADHSCSPAGTADLGPWNETDSALQKVLWQFRPSVIHEKRVYCNLIICELTGGRAEVPLWARIGSDMPSAGAILPLKS